MTTLNELAATDPKHIKVVDMRTQKAQPKETKKMKETRETPDITIPTQHIVERVSEPAPPESVEPNPLEVSFVAVSYAIRQQVLKELEVSQEKIEEMTRAKKEVLAEIRQFNDYLVEIRSQLNQKNAQLGEINRFLMKFSPEAINALVADRLESVQAIMEGRVPSKKAPKKSRAATPTTVAGYATQYTIDDQPRSFKTKTHLTYWLSQKLGYKVTVNDLNVAFRDQAGIVPFSSEHQEKGTITATFGLIVVSITLTPA